MALLLTFVVEDLDGETEWIRVFNGSDIDVQVLGRQCGGRVGRLCLSVFVRGGGPDLLVNQVRHKGSFLTFLRAPFASSSAAASSRPNGRLSAVYEWTVARLE